LSKVSTHNRSLQGTNPQSRGDSSLELEAIAAVHELSFAVQSISVSEMLPRTPELIFVNVTTIEDLLPSLLCQKLCGRFQAGEDCDFVAPASSYANTPLLGDSPLHFHAHSLSPFSSSTSSCTAPGTS
uniref:GSK3-beta interaction protein (inferred by orthology to a human protein) n=1 Tax=Anisakis simplex TaxID=6269 RepID=A0A0M3KCQ4_ANISI